MRRFPTIRTFVLVGATAVMLAACGKGSGDTNETGNTATTEMLSTETTIDGTTNDATSMDAATGLNNEVAATGNEAAADNAATAQ